ncbi:MAG: 2-dehydropantoate 2-reductase [Burkholderiaceae bacterium]|nr:2-dehydropantoate 2-reductase [Burkholderiaceae bacterium]
MKVLVIGAGAVGAYFGARLLEAGVDVTFLVRPARAAQLRQGLSVKSPLGDVHIAAPPHVISDNLGKDYGLILLSCKAYDLPGAIESFSPAVGADTAILPLLNGMRHLDQLRQRFGARPVLGGQCQISATLAADGSVLHLNETHQLSFGELENPRSDRALAIEAMLSKAKFDSRRSDSILQEMWEKWVFIAALAGSTCSMRASVGDIVRAAGADFGRRMLGECAAIAAAQGFSPRQPFIAKMDSVLTDTSSTLAASMLRDIERGARTEAEHVVGDLLARRGRTDERSNSELSLLALAYAHLKAYELRRAATPTPGR